MESIGHILLGISNVLGFLLLLTFVYQLVLTLFGFRKNSRDYAEHAPRSRFLILVPAHNEEQVIGDIVDNLQRMDYPKELYDFYIIADNCTDRTADVVRARGGNVLEFQKESPDAPTGKPIALKRALDQLGDYAKKYDLLMIFDADNLMDTNMFREVNSQYLDQGKPDFIQCYLGCKNKTGLVAWYDYVSFTISNRFTQLAKHRLGLNCGIGGTGYAMSTSYLKERGGWTTMSLTEDLEIQVEAVLQGRRILWNHNTRVYDEKPTRFLASLRQKIRWGQGHWFVFFHNLIPSIRSVVQGKISFWEFLSIFHCMASPCIYIFGILQLLIAGILLIPAFGIPAHPIFAMDFITTLWTLVVFLYSCIILFYVADRMDNQVAFHISTLPLMVGNLVINAIISVISQVVGLFRFRQQQHWVKTEHTMTAASMHSGVHAT